MDTRAGTWTHRLVRLIALAGMLALAGCSSTAPTAPTALIGPCGPALVYPDYAWSPDGSRIAFIISTSLQNAPAPNIFAMNADGKQLRQLTTAGDPVTASWSPDGRWIVFASNGPRNIPRLYVINPDGSGQTALMQPTQNGYLPAWSPDGTHIAYKSYQSLEGMNMALMMMAADGSDQTVLVGGSNIPGSFAWSPDGKRIAFVRMRMGNLEEIDTVDVAAQAVTTLASLGAVNVSLGGWSPDGRLIVYENDDMGGIYTIASDGSGQPKLLAGSNKEHTPSWSPDGRRILFEAWTDGSHFELYTMNPDGSAISRLTTGTLNNTSGEWSPDGRRIVFTSERDGAPDLYVMNSDGSHQTRLTLNPASQRCLQWPF